MHTEWVTEILGSKRPGIRAAMFVDFDNVYTGLKALDPGAAERFATNPGEWMRALAALDGAADEHVRRFLIRNCYLNPTVYGKYRTFWTRAGFRVVDCPSLTRQGKSGTDINLVLDAVDVLAGPTHIDQFFLASADADFTSLVQRFRAADRQTTVIVAGAVSSAYQEMADAVVQSDDFLSMLIGTTSTSVNGETGSTEPALETYRSITVSDASAADTVRELVTGAPGPVKSGIVASHARATDPSLANHWGGYGKFGTWVAQIDNRVKFSPTPVPGWVWDANRFSEKDLPYENALPSDNEPKTSIEQQVASTTDVPGLSRSQYRQVFLSLAEKAGETTNRNELAKMVRDACVEAGAPVARRSINTIIQGLIFSIVPLNGELTAGQLAVAWTKNVESMCELAGLQFDDEEMQALRYWTSGGFLEDTPKTVSLTDVGRTHNQGAGTELSS